MLLLKILAIYFAAASLITLILYGVDKYKAVHGLWRISERTLLLSSFLGGAVGGSMGMLLFRHKTRYPRFHRGLPILFFLQFILCLYIFQSGG